MTTTDTPVGRNLKQIGTLLLVVGILAIGLFYACDRVLNQ